MPDRRQATTSGNGELLCSHAEFHFIYSFCLEDKDKDSFVIQTDRPDLADSSQAQTGRPDDRKGISQHLKFKSNTLWWRRQPFKARIGALPVEVGCLTRVFSIAGTCCITVSTTGRVLLEQADILPLLDLVKQREDAHGAKPTLAITLSNGARTTVYKLFREAIAETCTKTKTSWLEKTANLVAVQQETQSPWLVAALEVRGAAADVFCHKASSPAAPPGHIESIRDQVAPILFRSVSGGNFELDPAYVAPDTPAGIPGFSNLNIDRRLYVQSSRRAVLCMTEDFKNDPARYFLPGLLDINEMVRARWQMLLIMNRLIDRTLRELAAVQRAGNALEQQFTALLKLREWLAISYEDPGSYLFAGDAHSMIYDNLRRVFRIEELTDFVAAKVQLLDQLLSDAVRLQWTKRGHI